MGGSLSPVIMNGTTVLLKSINAPWRRCFSILFPGNCIKQAGFTSLLTKPLFSFNQAGSSQVTERTLHRADGNVKISSDCRDCRPTLPCGIGPVSQIQVHSHRPVRHVGFIQLIEPAHRPSPPIGEAAEQAIRVPGAPAGLYESCRRFGTGFFR